MDVWFGAILGFAIEGVARCAMATVAAWREVRSLIDAPPRRAVAALLHVLLAIPFVVGTIDLARIAFRALDDDLFMFLVVLILIPIVACALVASALFISGSLIGGAGCLSGNGAHRVAGLVTAVAAILVGLTLMESGSYTYGWPILALAVLVLGAHALLWGAHD